MLHVSFSNMQHHKCRSELSLTNCLSNAAVSCPYYWMVYSKQVDVCNTPFSCAYFEYTLIMQSYLYLCSHVLWCWYGTSSYIPSTKLGLYFLIRTKQLELPVAVLILMGFMIFHCKALHSKTVWAFHKQQIYEVIYRKLLCAFMEK